ncbi:MAG: IS256 family transposase [Solirubrobacteraceae bacterium]
MVNDTMGLLELLRKAEGTEDLDFMREALRFVCQALIDLEAAAAIGAEPYERADGRVTHRNGTRDRALDTRVGTLELKIPKLRAGSFFPSMLEPRRRIERALWAVVIEAYVHGVSTRKVDDLVKAMGATGVSRSEVSRICRDLDAVVEAFRGRKLEGDWPYVWLDATFHKVREAGQVVSVATVVAIAVAATGERRILGVDVGASEDHTFWLSFLRSLKARGLQGTRLVISDAHEGLRRAIEAVFAGASWQRCRVHFMRNALVLVPRAAQPMVAAAIRTVFAQGSYEEAMAQVERVGASLQLRFPAVVELLRSAAPDVLAHLSPAFPAEHRRRLHSTNPLERLNKEIKRRSDVVGIFPNRASLLRLVGAVLLEQDDEWAVGRRYFSAESMGRIGAETFESEEEVRTELLSA